MFNNLSLRRPSSLFRCETTGRVWPRSVLGCAPNPGSFGTLSAATHDQLDSDPRLGRRRREYRESPIFRMGLWSDEHSAQLDPRGIGDYRTCSSRNQKCPQRDYNA